jgi:hypothetical protein
VHPLGARAGAVNKLVPGRHAGELTPRPQRASFGKGAA